MDIIDYESTPRPEWWLRQLALCDWTAGLHLHALLAENRFHETYGEKSRILMLTDGTKLVSFCTYAEQDDIHDCDLTPWLGFVWTHPDYRGRRLMGRLIARVKTLARDDGYEKLFISTGETGLYEKYGAEFLTVMKDRRGADSRVYTMETFGFYGHERADVKARIADYAGIETPKDLYRALWHVWKQETCASRMQEDRS